MQFVEAFKHLGYKVEAPRQDWSAEKTDGICISLWRKEMGTRNRLPWMNTHVHADPIENWGQKPGNSKRIRHLHRALKQFGGRVDVVIVSGDPGISYGTAQPWLAEAGRANTYWQVTDFDDETGHLKLFWSRKMLSRLQRRPNSRAIEYSPSRSAVFARSQKRSSVRDLIKGPMQGRNWDYIATFGEIAEYRLAPAADIYASARASLSNG